MTEAQRLFFSRAHARVARLEPAVAAAFLYAWQFVTDSLPDALIAKLIAAGAVERIITAVMSDVLLNQASVKLRTALRSTLERAHQWNVPYLPGAGKQNGQIVVQFDHLNPRIEAAIRTLETRVVRTMQQTMRDGVRERIRLGLVARESPASIARALRPIVGLPPNLVQAVFHFEQMLRGGDLEALTRELRDKRFDRTLAKALGPNGTGLSEAQIERQVISYRQGAIEHNAERVGRTATMDAYKIAQRESWQSAIDAGITEPSDLRRQWIGVGDDRERDSHLVMNNEAVAFDEPYSNGDTYAGESEPWNCRCLDRVFVARVGT